MAGEGEYSRKLGLSLRPKVNRRLNFSNYFNWSFDVFFSLIFSPVRGGIEGCLLTGGKRASADLYILEDECYFSYLRSHKLKFVTIG